MRRFMRRRPASHTDRRPPSGPAAQIVGITSGNDLYEFHLAESGEHVSLHDSTCVGVELRPPQEQVVLTFATNRGPGEPDSGADTLVQMQFDGAAVVAWEHDDGPAKWAGQVKDLTWDGGRLFELGLLNEYVIIRASRVSIARAPHPRAASRDLDAASRQAADDDLDALVRLTFR